MSGKVYFSTMYFDNLDHNKRSNLSNSDFHSICITIINHLSHENMGQQRQAVMIELTDDNTEIRLLEKYAVVPQIEALGKSDVFCPKRIIQPMILHQ